MEGFHSVCSYGYSSSENVQLIGWHFCLILVSDWPKRRRNPGFLWKNLTNEKICHTVVLWVLLDKLAAFGSETYLQAIKHSFDRFNRSVGNHGGPGRTAVVPSVPFTGAQAFPNLAENFLLCISLILNTIDTPVQLALKGTFFPNENRTAVLLK